MIIQSTLLLRLAVHRYLCTVLQINCGACPQRRLLTHPSNPPFTNNSCTAPPKSPTFTSHVSPPPILPSTASSTVTRLFFTSHFTFHPVRLVSCLSWFAYNFRSFSNRDGTSRHSKALLMELRLKISPNEPATTMGIFRA